MTHWQTVSGEVVDVGRILHQGGPDDCYHLDSVVFRDINGTIVRVMGVVVPGAIYWMLKAGVRGQFKLLHLTYPKPFGSYLRSFLIGMKSSEGSVDGESNVRKWVRDSKGGAFHFLWFGVVLMPAFGVGLLLWICAARLLMLTVPSESDHS
jgi:hypothetical protein